MRGLESLMLAGLVALLGLGIWQGRHWLPQDLLRTMNPPASAAVPATKALPPNTAKKSRLTHDRSAMMERLASEQSSPTVVVVPLPARPKASSIEAGTTTTELRARYGNPTLRVATRRDGHLVERYYYLSEDQSELTVATLEDGAVTHTETAAR